MVNGNATPWILGIVNLLMTGGLWILNKLYEKQNETIKRQDDEIGKLRSKSHLYGVDIKELQTQMEGVLDTLKQLREQLKERRREPRR